MELKIECTKQGDIVIPKKQLRKGLWRGVSAGGQSSEGCQTRANGKAQTADALCTVDEPADNGFTEAGGFESRKDVHASVVPRGTRCSTNGLETFYPQYI